MYAGFLRRLGAFSIDAFLPLAIYFLGFGYKNTFYYYGFTAQKVNLLFTVVLPALIFPIIYAFMESLKTATPGKKLCKIAVVNKRGQHLTLSRALLRNYLKYGIAFFLIAPIILISAGAVCIPWFAWFLITVFPIYSITIYISSIWRSLHDIIMGSIVIHENVISILASNEKLAQSFRSSRQGIYIGIAALLIILLFTYHLTNTSVACV